MKHLTPQQFTGHPHHTVTNTLLLVLALIAITLIPRTGQAIQFKPLPQPALKKTPAAAQLLLPSRTTVRIWDGRGEYGKEHFQCLEEAVTSVPSVDRMKQWWVMWSTEETGISKAVYQVSMFPFPENTRNWQSPPGLLKTGGIQTIKGTGRQPLLAIDLASLLPGSQQPSQQTVLPAKKSLSLKETIQPLKTSIRSNLKLNRPDLQQTSTKPLFSLKDNQPLAISFYVRIVTLNAAGNLAALPSKPAVLHISTPGDSRFVWYGDPDPNPATPERHAPLIRIVRYEPYQPYMSDWDRQFIVTKNMPILGYTKGQEIFLPRDDGSKSGWEAVSDAIGTIAGFVADSVNRVANAYNGLKQKALDLAISLAKNTVGCGKVCQAAFTFGLDYGLAAMGMPPSLPDFDAMMSMGKDYIIAEIASEASPYLSEDEVRQAINHLESEARKTADNGADGSKWLRLNPKYQYHDAMLLLEVSNPSSSTTDRINCRINQFREAFYFPFEPKNYSINIPPVKPGQTIQIPVMLRPNNVQCNNGKGMLMKDWNTMMEKGVLLSVYPGQNEQVLVKQ